MWFSPVITDEKGDLTSTLTNQNPREIDHGVAAQTLHRQGTSMNVVSDFDLVIALPAAVAELTNSPPPEENLAWNFLCHTLVMSLTVVSSQRQGRI
jgi:hypothetical protein